MQIFLTSLIIVGFFMGVKRKKRVNISLSNSWTTYLDEVNFYTKLTPQQQHVFKKRVKTFLFTTPIKGIDTEVTEKDRVLLGASAIIPIFNFRNWKYNKLDEILLFSDAFNINFNKGGEKVYALGAVGESGPLKNKMGISKKALHFGFDNQTDKINTAVHEFIHLIDGADGKIDGISKVLMNQPNAIPWINLMYEKIHEIRGNDSCIREYGGSNYVEFFAVTSEYFFERPDLLKKQQPELYSLLSQMYRKRIF